MKRTRNKKSGSVKPLLAAAGAVCAVTLAFQGLTQIALAAELGKAEAVPTNYAAAISSAGEQSKPGLPDGYTKPSYTLAGSNREKPSSTELSREEAAEVGVQGLYTAFGLDMNGKEIDMSFHPAENGFRAYWEGSYWPNGKTSSSGSHVASYYFRVDAISGELCSVQNSRVLSGNVSTGFDSGLNQNAGEYEAMAKALATELGIFQSPVNSVAYEGQGTTNNDPDIFLLLTSESGERAQLMFSRHDKALLAITYDIGMRERDVALRNDEAFDQRAAEFFRNNPGAEHYAE